MKQYQDLIKHILKNGYEKGDRTGTGTISVFGYQMRFDLKQGFPLVTTKKVHTKSIIHELLWFLKGDTNTKYLHQHGVTIWDEWASVSGDLGPIYGKQWRAWEGVIHKSQVGDKAVTVSVEIDQIKAAIDELRKNPDSRRIIVNAWNVAQLSRMALTPCHALFQFYTRPIPTKVRIQLAKDAGVYDLSKEDEKAHKDSGINEYLDKCNVPKRFLSCQLYQRSADVGLGVPFNIASYALLVHMFAHVLNMVPDEFIWTGGDTHIYSNHIDQLKEQSTREPYPLPQLKINRRVESIDDFKFEDFEIVGYQHHPAISMKVAV